MPTHPTTIELRMVGTLRSAHPTSLSLRHAAPRPGHVTAALVPTGDLGEGINAWIERRPPVYTGR